MVFIVRVEWSSRMTKCKGKKIGDSIVRLSSVLIKTEDDARDIIKTLLKLESFDGNFEPRRPIPKRIINHNGIEWILGYTIRSGGFGIIKTCVSDAIKCIVKFSKAAKLDPSIENELTFYKSLPPNDFFPKYFGSGVTMVNGTNRNYIILDRYRTDLSDFMSRESLLVDEIDLIATSILKAIKFCHAVGYSHGDIKIDNVLLDFKVSRRERVVTRVALADFGFAMKYRDCNGNHIDYKERPGKGYGTRCCMSIDAHNGVVCSRRSDIESMAYLILTMFEIELPWATRSPILDREQVKMEKLLLSRRRRPFGRVDPKCKDYLSTIKYSTISTEEYVNSYRDEPKYERLLDIFNN